MSGAIRLLIVLAVCVCAVPVQAVWSQERVTAAELEALRLKLDAQAETYRRIDQAEQEALAENEPEKAKVFAEAKAKVYGEYVAVNAQLQKAQMQKREQDQRAAAPVVR